MHFSATVFAKEMAKSHYCEWKIIAEKPEQDQTLGLDQDDGCFRWSYLFWPIISKYVKDFVTDFRWAFAKKNPLKWESSGPIILSRMWKLKSSAVWKFGRMCPTVSLRSLSLDLKSPELNFFLRQKRRIEWAFCLHQCSCEDYFW